jgi:phosphoserine phosphatase
MNTHSSWQLKNPIDAVIFDCDGTLSTIEGINELAKNNGVGDIIAALTHEAMSVSGLNPEIYQQRLHLIHPKKHQVQALGDLYFKHCVPDAMHVIQILQRLHKTVYIVSAGVNPAVTIFGEKLGIPREQIYAVNMEFDLAGNYLDFDHASPLIFNHGKRQIVELLKNKHPHILHIGDGLNDYITHDIVTRYIGYGGVYYRENLANLCEYYIRSLSLAPILPLCLTEQESKILLTHELKLYLHGMNMRSGNIDRSKDS